MTKYSRGTSSYRAPELLKDGTSTFTNKVDIWAIGCILYELVARKKVFVGDGAIFQYSLEYASCEKNIEIPFATDTLPDEDRRIFVSRMIREMLEIVADKRPRAEDVYKGFINWDFDLVDFDTTPGQSTPGPTSVPSQGEPMNRRNPNLDEHDARIKESTFILNSYGKYLILMLGPSNGDESVTYTEESPSTQVNENIQNDSEWTVVEDPGNDVQMQVTRPQGLRNFKEIVTRYLLDPQVTSQSHTLSLESIS